MKTTALQVFLSIFFISFISCTKEGNKPLDTGFLHGIFIVNEGNLNSNNGSISYYNPDSAKLIDKLFLAINKRAVGDVIQSFGIAADKGFIVANNSQKVEVVDMETFLNIGTITGVNYPRYFLKVTDSKGYLTNGSFGGYVFVIDLNSLLIINEIPVGNGPENLILLGEKVLVANSGGWINDNTVSVIDIDSDIVTDTIGVGDNPVDLVADMNGFVWVLCKGKVVYDQDWNIIDETDSEIYVINSEDYSVLKSFSVGRTGDFFNPIRLAASPDGSTIYFLESDGIYKMNIADIAPPLTPIINRKFYGFDIDQGNGLIYGLDANNFASDGYLYRYTVSGDLIDSMKVGIGPNSAVSN